MIASIGMFFRNVPSLYIYYYKQQVVQDTQLLNRVECGGAVISGILDIGG